MRRKDHKRNASLQESNPISNQCTQVMVTPGHRRRNVFGVAKQHGIYWS